MNRAALAVFDTKLGDVIGKSVAVLLTEWPELVEKFKELRSMGHSYRQIGDILGLSQTTVQIHINANYYRFIGRSEWHVPTPLCSAVENDWRKQRHTIPKGPVTLNQALLGDPLTGRSALDRRENA